MALKSINLTGEQKKVLFLPATNPIQIKGVAGSGKTTIAMYRAKHLLESYSDLFREAEIMIFTYNNSLTQYIQSHHNPPKPVDLTTLSVDDEIYLTSLGAGVVLSVSEQETITTGKSVLILEADFEIGQSCKVFKSYSKQRKIDV